MESYVQRQIGSGAYANLSEVVRAGIRLLMERDGARRFYALNADLEDDGRRIGRYIGRHGRVAVGKRKGRPLGNPAGTDKSKCL